MTRTEELYLAFCEQGIARLTSGKPLDPKELEVYVKFLKDQNVLETPEVKEGDVNPDVLKRFKANVESQTADYG
jgi:hypothetical protein